MNTRLIPPSMLFRFSLPCRRLADSEFESTQELPPDCRLPLLGTLDGAATFADVRWGWTPGGFALSLRVEGKKQSLWCRETIPEESDGISIWIDTRNMQTVHRASRFCHRICIFPGGRGDRYTQPWGGMIPIDRAREHPKMVGTRDLVVYGEVRDGGYFMRATIPAEMLSGFDTEEQRQVGFFYAVRDRELGCQLLTLSDEFPYQWDPSLWTTLELVDK